MPSLFCISGRGSNEPTSAGTRKFLVLCSACRCSPICCCVRREPTRKALLLGRAESIQTNPLYWQLTTDNQQLVSYGLSNSQSRILRLALLSQSRLHSRRESPHFWKV